jgi:drug/metabolite transporter (DMT)-like permease
MLWVFLAIIGALANAAFYILVRKYIKILDPRMLTAAGFIGVPFFFFSSRHCRASRRSDRSIGPLLPSLHS